MNTPRLYRHVLGLALAFAVLIALPFLMTAGLALTSWLVGLRLGFHIYDTQATMQQPFGLATFTTLASVSAICILGDFARRWWSFLTWALPLLSAVPFGVWVACASRGDDVPGGFVAALGLTATLVAFLLVGAYWYVLVLT